MPVRVVQPPDPLVTPGDIPGAHEVSEAAVAALIAAYQATIDGPAGWVGRSFGVQVLEASLACWDDICRLPCGPVIEVESISYVDCAGNEVFLPDADWTFDEAGAHLAGHCARPALASRAWPIKVQYRAGYDGDVTGDLPEQARQAVIEYTRNALTLSAAGAGLRSESVEGIGSTSYLDADRLAAANRAGADALLAGLRVFSL